AVRKLLVVLADPAVRDWLRQQHAVQAAAPAVSDTTASSYIANRVATVREHVQALVAALPTGPVEFERVGTILSLAVAETGLGSVLLLIAAFVALGLGIEWLFRWLTRGVQTWIMHVPLDTVGERLRAVAIRLAFGLLVVVAFAVGSIGAFSCSTGRRCCERSCSAIW